MKLISVNVGQERDMNAKSLGKTGIFKEPVATRVQIGALGLAGDTICDVEHHGGPDQAVYLYSTHDYAWWSTELGRNLAPGTFGENLTVSGVESAGCRIGDRFHIGTVTLEVTAPRVPCVTLATRMDDPRFVKRFHRAERPGLYCRVIQEGWVQVGDDVRYEPYSNETVTALEMFRDFGAKLDEATLRRYLAAPIAVRSRVYLQAELDKLETPHGTHHG